MQGCWGVTPGKWICGLRTTRTTLSPCGFVKSLYREVRLPLDRLFFLPSLALSNGMRCERNWSIVRRIGNGQVSGGGNGGTRIKSAGLAGGPCHSRDDGWNLSTFRKRRRNWRHFDAVENEANRSVERNGLPVQRRNLASNQRFVHQDAQGRRTHRLRNWTRPRFIFPLGRQCPRPHRGDFFSGELLFSGW
jgi:hypothetical protein